MKPSTYYLLALLLVVASIPLYMKLARADVDRSASFVPGADVSPLAGAGDLPVKPRRLISPEQIVAVDAILRGDARCVAGIVYSTANHVIEPLPGRIKCIVDARGRSYVTATPQP